MPSPPADGAGSRRAIAAWCLYDWANSAFPTVIITFVFAPYFTQAVAETEIQGSAQWAWAVSISALVVALLGPTGGAVADAAGRRKPWIFALTVLCVVCAYLLWYVRPTTDDVMLALAIFVVANVAFEFATVFYNAMLPDITPARLIGRVSGWAWGLGYAGGLVCLVIVLVAFVQTDSPLFGLDKSETELEHVRAVGPMSALWYAFFSLPLFLFTPDRRSTGISPVQAVHDGLATLVQSLRDIRRHANVARYLLARMIYTDGLNTLFAFGGIFAAHAFGMDIEERLIFGIVMNVTAGLGAAAFAWIDDWIGAKRTILIALVGLIVVGTALILVHAKLWFWMLAPVLGVFFGPAQAASRSLMARLAPAEMRAEMFGLYAFSGKSSAFVGPMLYGVFTTAFGSDRAGMATVLVFFLVGFYLLLSVREPRTPAAQPSGGSGAGR
ncbi:MAG: MFS transporter [Proteobacteria bacterium]|nr:MFS transporter [Pseudomonadota bacterium]